MATLGRNMQLILHLADFFTVKIRLCWIAFSLIKKIGRNLEGSSRDVKVVLPP